MSAIRILKAFFLASRFVKSRASIGCMDLHARSCANSMRCGYTGCGSSRLVHLHEKWCMKRAGVAGIALRASTNVSSCNIRRKAVDRLN